MGHTSLSLIITFLTSGCSTYKIDETFSYPTTSEYRPTSRNSKSLFGTDNSREIGELRYLVMLNCKNCIYTAYIILSESDWTGWRQSFSVGLKCLLRSLPASG